MKLGFVTAILPELTLEEVVRFAAAEGFACIEPMCWPRGRAERRYAGVTHIDTGAVAAGEAARVRDLCGEAGVGLSALGYYPNLLSPDQDEARAAGSHLETVIRAAPLLGVDTVCTFIGRDPHRSVDANWPRMLEVWRPLVRMAEDAGVRIAIENCPMLFTDDEWPGGKNLAASPRIWRRLFEDLDSPSLGLNFDPSHFVWQQMDYCRAIREFGSRLFHVHAKDARVDRHRLDEVGILAPPLEYHSPKLPGLGDVRWGAFFSALTDAGYAGPVCIEVEDRAYEGSLESRREAIRQSARFLRAYVG